MWLMNNEQTVVESARYQLVHLLAVMWCGVGVASKLLMQTSSVDDDAHAVDDMKARRMHAVLEQIRARGLPDVNTDRRSVLNELQSFANTLNGHELMPVQAAGSYQERHQQSYSDRLAQTRGDLKLLEQLVSQTFHLQPQQSPPHDSSRTHLTDQQPPQQSPPHDSSRTHLTDQQPVIQRSSLLLLPILLLLLLLSYVQPSWSQASLNRNLVGQKRLL